MRPPDYCLLGRKKSGVVTDGLIFWLDTADDFFDAVQKLDGLSSLSFLDRVSERVINFTSTEDKSARFVRTEDGAIATKYNNLPSVTLEEELQGIKTIEIVSKGIGSSYNAKIFDKFIVGKRNFYPFYSSPTAAKIETDYSIVAETSQKVGTGDIITGLPLLYQNCSLEYCEVGASAKPVESFGSANVLRDSPFYALYSIRVYNRFLSPEEILQNYNYEKSLGRVI